MRNLELEQSIVALARQQQASQPKRHQKPPVELPFSTDQLAALNSLGLVALGSPLHVLEMWYSRRRDSRDYQQMCDDALREIRNILAAEKARALSLAEQIKRVEAIL